MQRLLIVAPLAEGTHMRATELLAHGPSRAALVPSPVMRAMEAGTIVRVEELTRIPADVQDALITILSEKTLPIAELR